MEHSDLELDLTTRPGTRTELPKKEETAIQQGTLGFFFL